MSQHEQPEAAGAESIGFEHAEFAAGEAATRCAVCGEPLSGSYFEINGVMVCPPCRAKVAAVGARGTATTRVLRSVGAGVGAAIVGAGLYYAVLAITGYEIGLIAIAVGFLVGRAVRWGCYQRGGWLYQGLAVALTYVAIVSTYIPFVVKAMQEKGQDTAASSAAASPSAAATAATSTASKPAIPAPAQEMSAGELIVGLGVMAGFVLAIPFLGGVENFMGWVIIGFALFQAWKMNRRRQLLVSGPFRLAAASAPPVGEATA